MTRPGEAPLPAVAIGQLAAGDHERRHDQQEDGDRDLHALHRGVQVLADVVDHHVHVEGPAKLQMNWARARGTSALRNALLTAVPPHQAEPSAPALRSKLWRHPRPRKSADNRTAPHTGRGRLGGSLCCHARRVGRLGTDVPRTYPASRSCPRPRLPRHMTGSTTITTAEDFSCWAAPRRVSVRLRGDDTHRRHLHSAHACHDPSVGQPPRACRLNFVRTPRWRARALPVAPPRHLR